MSALALPLRYLIGAAEEDIVPDRQAIIEGPYDAPPIGTGPNIAYCNLFHEKYRRERQLYAPYLPDTDTSSAYGEGRIDPAGPGWRKNLDRQYELRHRQGHTCIELDNPDAYGGALFNYVLDEVHLASQYGLAVVAKNPLLLGLSKARMYIRHWNIVGAIVERDEDTEPMAIVGQMKELRKAVGRFGLPIWFVSWGRGESWARGVARAIRQMGVSNMGVTYSPGREYTSSHDILRFR